MKKQKVKLKEIIILILFAFATYLPVVFFNQNVCLTTFLVSLVSIFGILKWQSKTNSFVYLTGFVWGPLAESLCIYAGAWQYAYSNILNLPVWLFFVWGNAAIFLYQSGILVKRALGEK